jgi:hypothetical protein
MIRNTLSTDISTEKALELFADEITDIVYDLAQDSFEAVKTPLLDELRFYPPVPAGSKYVRTFALRRAWVARLDRNGRDRVDFVVENNVRYTQWVVGSLAQNPSQARRFQRDFHARNGWPLATETVAFFFEAYEEDFAERFDTSLNKIVSTSTRQRAFTRINP